MFESRYEGKLSFFPRFSSAKLAAHFHHKTTNSATPRINPLFISSKKSYHEHGEKSFAGTGSETTFPLSALLETIKSLPPF